MKQRDNEMKVPSRKKSQFHNDPTYKISEVSGEKPRHLDDQIVDYSQASFENNHSDCYSHRESSTPPRFSITVNACKDAGLTTTEKRKMSDDTSSSEEANSPKAGPCGQHEFSVHDIDGAEQLTHPLSQRNTGGG
mmetsp:Transcript_41288/g.62866  ORF Transcript_41288/g.62866 Transcript_41288/m.62866 type:complete len:135 (-) Transcript_41288:217-621(-)